MLGSLAFAAAYATGASDNSISLFVHDDLAGAKSPSQWQIDASGSNTINVNNGALTITAARNTYAHLRHPLNANTFRATTALQTDSADSWIPGMFLYWDNDNWCQITYRPGLFSEPSVYVYIMQDGNLITLPGIPDHERSDEFQYNLKTGWFGPKPSDAKQLHAWHQLGIDLTKNWIYFLTSKDGKTWTRFRKISRDSATMASMPRSLIVGKGYADKNYPAPNLNNDYSDHGPVVESKIKYVSIVPLTQQVIDQQTRAADFQKLDLKGDAILAKPGDPNYDDVAKVFPAMRYARENVGVKDHPDTFGVLTDGALQYRTGSIFFQVGPDHERFGVAGGFPTKSLDKGDQPIIDTRWSHDGLQYSQCIFGYCKDFNIDNPLYGYVRLTVQNTTDAPKQARVDLLNAPGNNPATKPAANWSFELAPKASHSIYVAIPYTHPAKIEQPSADQFNALHDQVNDYWDKLLNQAATIHVPEKRVDNAYRAWLAYNFLNVHKINGVYQPVDGSYFYPVVYGISASLYCQALDEYGYHDEARTYLDSLLTMVKPDGEFIVNYGLPDGGQLLLALYHHYQMTGDTAWLKSVTPTMAKMANWIIRQRQQSENNQAANSPFRGMIFQKPYCDYPQKAYNFVSDLTLAEGLGAASSAMQAAGDSAAAQHYHAAAASYHDDVMAAMKRAVVNVDGMKVLPMFPQTHALLKQGSFTACDYYSLLSGQLLELNSVKPDGWIARSIVNMMEKDGGLRMGVCRFGGGIDHAYTYGYLLNCIEQDKPRRALLGFYSFLAFGMTRNTYSGVEGTFAKTGMNFSTLPHLYSGTQQLRLLRSMLVYEDGDTLKLCQACPRDWLADGKRISMEDAGTRLGTISFKVESHLNQGKVLVHIYPPKQTQPKIELRLRCPDGRTIQSAMMNGRPVEVKQDQLLIGKLSAPATINVTLN